MDRSLVSGRPDSLALIQLLTGEQNKDKHLRNDLRPDSGNMTQWKSETFGETTPLTYFKTLNDLHQR